MSANLVYVLDDDHVMRTFSRKILEKHSFIVREFESPAEFLKTPPPTSPCCLVCDVEMPRYNGLEVQEILASKAWSLPIVFITAYGTVPLTARAMKAGAVDFLTKPFTPDTLVKAVTQALTLAETQWGEILRKNEAIRKLEKLTDREFEVLRWVIAGKLNKEIAAQLGTTERTIKAHRSKITEKLGVTSILDLARLADLAGVSPEGRL